ncbi:MAG: antibiotic biosynthesis monooxygenase [Proteobacteria bacterium]|nr:antibiotic biosynthesis monooxygenase [Pseudomonadota bacterium]
MKAIVAKLLVQAGKEAEFEKVALELAAQVEANEPGNQCYKLCKSADGDYFFVELYDSAEAMAAHRDMPHMKEAGPKFAGVMAGRPEITVLDVIGE